MVATMKANSAKMRSVASETTIGLMVNLTPATGPRTKWMDRAFSHGKMAKNTKVTSSTINVKVTVCLCGLMVVSISVHGKQANSTESVLISPRRVSQSMVSGRTVAKSDGSVEKTVRMTSRMICTE